MPIADKPNAVAIGTNSVTDDAVGVDGITINGTPHVFAGKQPASVVSFGSKARAGAGGVTQYNRQLTNVSAGQISADSLDAVNGSQLFAAVAEIETNAKQISKNKQNITTIEGDINTLNNRINDVSQNAINRANHYTDLQVNKGVAKASALAGLKFLDYNPKDKWSFAASVGHYRNANAVAVGAAYQPNENTMVHGGITLDGEVAYNLGVSFKTGGQTQVSRFELQEQVRQLQSDNARMQEELNEIRSMLANK